MASRVKGKRRGRPPISRVTLARASRLYRMVMTLGEEERTRPELLEAIGIGLRTFYRELELLRRCGVTVRLRDSRYHLIGTAEAAGGKLPVPDPHLSIADVSELARSPGPAGRRMAELLNAVRAYTSRRRLQGKRGQSRSKRRRDDGPERS